MKIIADENIPFVRDAFAHLGKVKTISGREMNKSNVRDADVLLIRSITQVNEALLEGSDIKFVATATIGTDHIDFASLEKREIGFCSAPGSNAESVAQYITSALLSVHRDHSDSLQNRTIGIVGVGNVGSRVARNAEAIGMKVLLCDPPLARKTGEKKYRPLGELLDADFITLHTPLTREGNDATFHLVDADFLQKMKPNSTLINTSRGAVIDHLALLQALKQETIAHAVLDVWEHEPNISIELLKLVQIGTPHIAGYSFDGKVRGTQMIYHAVCNHFNITPQWEEQQQLPMADVPHLTINTHGKSVEKILKEMVLPIYDISQDDSRLRKIIDLPETQRATMFDHLRKEYPIRREFCSTHLTLEPHHTKIANRLQSLQFNVNES